MRRIAVIAITAVVCAFSAVGQSPAEADQYNKRGVALFREGKFVEAEAVYRDGMAVAKAAGEDGLQQYTALITNLAVSLQSQGRIVEARKLLEECVSISTTKLGNRGTTLAHAYNNLALMHMAESQFVQGVALLKRALDLKFVEERTRAGTLHNLGAAYFDMGQRSKAEKLFQAALDEYTRLGNVDESSPILTYLARIAGGRGDMSRAESLLARGLEIRKKAFGPNHLNVALSLGDLGDFETERGHYDRAIECFQQALDIVEPVLGKDHLFSAPLLFHYADAKRKQGHYEEALGLYERTGRVLEQAFGPQHARLAAVYKCAAICSSKLKNKQKAKEYDVRAQSILDRTVAYGKYSVDTSAFLSNK